MSEEAKCDCEHCGGHIAYATELADQKVVCPHCGMKTVTYISQQISEWGKGYAELCEKILKTPPDQLTETERAISALLKQALPQIDSDAIIRAALKKVVKGGDKVLKPDEIDDLVSAILTERMFSMLLSEDYRNLRPFKKIIASATDRNDHDFFIRLGKELQRKPRHSLDGLRIFIAMLWDKGFSGFCPPLKFFTDEGLVDFLKIQPRFSAVTFDQVRKARQRLGLRSINIKGKIKGLEHKGKYFRFRWVDKG